MSIVDEGPLSLLTSAIGFLEAPFDEAAHALRSWCRTQWLFLRFKKGQIQDARDVMARLFPMTNVGCREVLLETDSRWVAYLNDSLLGADVHGTTSYLSEKLGTRGIMAACSRDIGFGRKQISHHNVRFSLYGPKPNPILNDLRNVQVTSDHGGRKWTFHESGKPLDFERTDAYKAKRVRDRFTVAMLEEVHACLRDPAEGHELLRPTLCLPGETTPLCCCRTGNNMGRGRGHAARGGFRRVRERG